MLTKEQEYRSNVAIWRTKPPTYCGQTIKEVATWFQEGDQKIDRYFFDKDSDGDWEASPGEKVKQSIRRHTALGKTEGQAWDSLEQASKQGEKLFFWISPAHEARGTDLKVIVSEVVNYKGRERLLNRSMLFEFGTQRSLDFVNDLVALSKNKPHVDSLEDIRKDILVFDPGQYWIGNLAKAARDPNLEEIVISGQDIVDQQQALERAAVFYDNEILDNQQTRLPIQPAAAIQRYHIGSHMGPCPPEEGGGTDAFEMVYNRAMPIVASTPAEQCQEIKCRGCGWKPKPYQLKMIQAGELTRCPDCDRAP